MSWACNYFGRPSDHGRSQSLRELGCRERAQAINAENKVISGRVASLAVSEGSLREGQMSWSLDDGERPLSEVHW